MSISRLDYVMCQMNSIYDGLEARELKVHRIFHLLKENETLVKSTRSIFYFLQLENMYEGFVHQHLGEYNGRIAFKMKVLSDKLYQCIQVINHGYCNESAVFDQEDDDLDLAFRI